MVSPQSKPHLSLSRILQMNLGFLGLQFSFGLQQGNMAPIYSYLGASEANLPFLSLAGPMTGLLIQPLIGAMSDRTSSKWGRRTPYFLIGAVMCSIGLFLMPLSSSLLMAASLLWLLDAGNNITMEPYRAYVKDRLNDDQHEMGFLSQSGFTGLAQMLAFVTPSILVYRFGISIDAVDAHNIPYTTRISFLIGAVLSITTILWSIWRVPELKLSDAERATLAALPKSASATLAEIWDAIVTMPGAMRKMAWMSLFQWYGMAVYWSYSTYAISRAIFATTDPNTTGFHTASLASQQISALYNLVAFVSAFAMVPITRRIGAQWMHALCLTCGGIGMMILAHASAGTALTGPGGTLLETVSLTQLAQHPALLFPALGIGLAWGSIMGNPYILLAGAIPPERTGVYMGIFNMFIVIPMLLIAATLPFYYQPLMGGDARNVILMAGILLVLAALAVLRIRPERADPR